MGKAVLYYNIVLYFGIHFLGNFFSKHTNYHTSKVFFNSIGLNLIEIIEKFELVRLLKNAALSLYYSFRFYFTSLLTFALNLKQKFYCETLNRMFV